MFTGDIVPSGPVDWSFEVLFSKNKQKQYRLSVSSVVLLQKRSSWVCDTLLLKKMRSAMTCSKFDFWIHFRRPWFIKALSCLSSLCWNPLQSSDALTSNLSSFTFPFYLPSLIYCPSSFFLLSYLFPLTPPPNRQANQNGNILSNQKSPSRSHACGGHTQSSSFAHAGQTLSSHFREIVRHHAAVLATKARCPPTSETAHHAGCTSSSTSASHHGTEAGAPHGGVDELLWDVGGGKKGRDTKVKTSELLA